MCHDTPDFALFYDLTTLSYSDRYNGDRFVDRGANLIIDTAIRATEKLKNLPAEDANRFALTIVKATDKITAKQDSILKRKESLPPQLPALIVDSDGLTFKRNRKRALTGREAADQQEADQARARRKAERLSRQEDIVEDTIEQESQQRRQQQDSLVAGYLASQVAFAGPSNNESSSSSSYDDEPPSTSTSRPARTRKPSAKQAS